MNKHVVRDVLIVILLVVGVIVGMTMFRKPTGYAATLAQINENLSFDYDFLQKMDGVDMTGLHSISSTYETSYIQDKYWSAYKSGGEYVLYSVSAYPNYTSEHQYITKIYCSDSSISLFGVSLNAGADTIRDALKRAGYEPKVVTRNGVTKVTCELKNGYTLGFYLGVTERYFAIAAKVSENSHIIIE